jgi:hypothetical protein
MHSKFRRRIKIEFYFRNFQKLRFCTHKNFSFKCSFILTFACPSTRSRLHPAFSVLHLPTVNALYLLIQYYIAKIEHIRPIVH